MVFMFQKFTVNWSASWLKKQNVLMLATSRKSTERSEVKKEKKSVRLLYDIYDINIKTNIYIWQDTCKYIIKIICIVSISNNKYIYSTCDSVIFEETNSILIAHNRNCTVKKYESIWFWLWLGCFDIDYKIEAIII